MTITELVRLKIATAQGKVVPTGCAKRGQPLQAGIVSVLVLLFLLSSIASAVADFPIPQCQPVAELPRLLSIARGDIPYDLEPSTRRNAEYFFGNSLVASDGQRPLHAQVLSYGPISVFFPAKECPKGCTAHLVWAKKNGTLVRPILFASHMVIAVFPHHSWLFLAADGEHLVEISTVESKSGGHSFAVHQWQPPPRWFEVWLQPAKSCLLTGTFGIDTSPSNPR